MIDKDLEQQHTSDSEKKSSFGGYRLRKRVGLLVMSLFV